MIATIIRFRAGVSVGHASIKSSSMSSSVISRPSFRAVAFLVALKIDDSESLGISESELTSLCACRSGGCGFEPRRAR
jgi:hypothetical protein